MSAFLVILSNVFFYVILSYYHNIYNSDTLSVVLAPITTTTITEATLISTYTTEIKASNILGYGPNVVNEIHKWLSSEKEYLSVYVLTYYMSLIDTCITPSITPIPSDITPFMTPSPSSMYLYYFASKYYLFLFNLIDFCLTETETILLFLTVLFILMLTLVLFKSVHDQSSNVDCD